MKYSIQKYFGINCHMGAPLQTFHQDAWTQRQGCWLNVEHRGQRGPSEDRAV